MEVAAKAAPKAANKKGEPPAKAAPKGKEGAGASKAKDGAGASKAKPRNPCHSDKIKGRRNDVIIR